jgi:chemotaxis protein CheD
MPDQIVTVKIAEMGVVRDDRRLKTILGSCVGIILRDPEKRVSGLAHIMLPERHRADTTEGKYADTAIPALVARVACCDGRTGSLQALVIGGAQMFPLGNARIASVGDQNVAASRAILGRCRIPIVFEDTGGTSGRSVTFDNMTGAVSVRTLQTIRGKGEGA